MNGLEILSATVPLYMSPSDIPNVRRLVEVVQAGDKILGDAVKLQRDRWGALGRLLLTSIEDYPRNSDARAQWLKDTGLDRCDSRDRSAAVWFYENRERIERDGIAPGVTHPRRIQRTDTAAQSSIAHGAQFKSEVPAAGHQVEVVRCEQLQSPPPQAPLLSPAADGALEIPATPGPALTSKPSLRTVKFEHRDGIAAVVAAVRKQSPNDIELQIQIASAALAALKAARETELSIDQT
jgi:hypothetical protein